MQNQDRLAERPVTRAFATLRMSQVEAQYATRQLSQMKAGIHELRAHIEQSRKVIAETRAFLKCHTDTRPERLPR
jgi:hypothetical protein